MGGSGSDEPIVYSGEEQRLVQAGGGDLVAVGVRDALDEAVQTKPAQVVAGAPGGPGIGVGAEQPGEMGAQVTVGEPVRLQPEGEQRGEQGLGAWVTEAQRGGVLAVDVDGVVDGAECVGSGDRVVADALDAQ